MKDRAEASLGRQERAGGTSRSQIRNFKYSAGPGFRATLTLFASPRAKKGSFTKNSGDNYKNTSMLKLNNWFDVFHTQAINAKVMSKETRCGVH